jgi:hypothetical protein
MSFLISVWFSEYKCQFLPGNHYANIVIALDLILLFHSHKGDSNINYLCG